MRAERIGYLLFCLVFLGSPSASNAQTVPEDKAAAILAKLRAAIGEEARLRSMRSLSATGRYRRRSGKVETAGEVRLEILLPDKILITEKSSPRPSVTVNMLQAVNGDKFWVDRQVSSAAGEDESVSQSTGLQNSAPTQVSNSTIGMRDTVNGRTSVRNDIPAGGQATERTMLGMRIPTSSAEGRGSGLEQLNQERRSAQGSPAGGNRPPGLENPSVKSSLESQARKDFLCLALALGQTATPGTKLSFSHGGLVNAGPRSLDAIEIAGPDEFAARMFIDQATSRADMISYREIIMPNAGYIVSTDPSNPPAEGKEIAVQLQFADYRPIDGMNLPHLSVKAVNGFPVQEWKIEKYKLNPDLKPKRFEKK